MELGAVVVAAGMSSRMGDFKPMLHIGEISIAQRVILTLKQAGAERIAVITGYRADELEKHLFSPGVVFLRNEKYETTEMFDSACIGLKYMKDKCEKLLFTPVDVPLFSAQTATALIESGAMLAAPVTNGKRGHPILMSGQVIEDLINDSGEGGLSGAMARSSTKLSLIPVNDLGILHDADTPEDYKALLEIHNRRLIRPVAEVSLHKEKLFFDSKIAMLLELVGETGSVSGACKRMQMSYSAGWKTINTVEKQAGTVLIERNQGGASGGSSELTKEGRKLLERFRKLSAEVSEAAERAYEKIFSEQSE